MLSSYEANLKISQPFEIDFAQVGVRKQGKPKVCVTSGALHTSVKWIPMRKIACCSQQLSRVEDMATTIAFPIRSMQDS